MSSLHVIGALVFGLGTCGVWIAIAAYGIARATRRLNEIEGAKRVTIANAPRHGIVQITGTVVPSERGTFRPLLGGSEVVYARTVITRAIRPTATPMMLVDEVRSVPFMLDDGSGTPALVDPEGAEISLQASGMFDDGGARATVEAELARRGIRAEPEYLYWRHFTIAPREELLVRGMASSVPADAVPTAYRDRPARMLRVSKPPRGAGELLISEGSVADLAADLRAERSRAVVFAVLGGVFTLVCAALLLYVIVAASS